MVVESPHLRADAQRNLERILEAAHVVFAERGLDASVSEIAERAGVGTATIFRRFPTKDDLVEATLERVLLSFESRAIAAAESDDPAAAIGELMTWIVGRFIEDRCLCDTSGGQLFARPRMLELTRRLTEAVELLLRRAQEAGAIREDVVAEDLSFLLSAVGRSGTALERTAPGAWRRYVGIVLDGLRPEGATPLEYRPPTHQQLHDAKTQPQL